MTSIWSLGINDISRKVNHVDSTTCREIVAAVATSSSAAAGAAAPVTAAVTKPASASALTTCLTPIQNNGRTRAGRD